MKALYEVQIGGKTKDTHVENIESVRVLAEDAVKAADYVQLNRGEYVAQVLLIGRATL